MTTPALRLLNLRACLASIEARAAVARMKHPVEMVASLAQIERAAGDALKQDDEQKLNEDP